MMFCYDSSVFCYEPSYLIGSHFLDSRVLVSKDLSKIKGFERVQENRFVLFLKMFFFVIG